MHGGGQFADPCDGINGGKPGVVLVGSVWLRVYEDEVLDCYGVERVYLDGADFYTAVENGIQSAAHIACKPGLHRRDLQYQHYPGEQQQEGCGNAGSYVLFASDGFKRYNLTNLANNY